MYTIGRFDRTNCPDGKIPTDKKIFGFESVSVDVQSDYTHIYTPIIMPKLSIVHSLLTPIMDNNIVVAGAYGICGYWFGTGRQ